MEALDALHSSPAIAEAMERARPATLDDTPAGTARPWTLVAREHGSPGHGVTQVRDLAQGRAMALQLSELGFVVTLHDADDNVRLCMWPPS
jgi:hypothetical protein